MLRYTLARPVVRAGARSALRFKSDFRLKPDPNRVPSDKSPQERFKDSAPKTGTIEDFQLYERQTPPNNISSVLKNGFKLDNGARVISDSVEHPKGLLLLAHEAFTLDLSDHVTGLQSGRVELEPSELLGVFEIVHPKPELLVLGLGGKSRILGPRTHKFLRELGMQVDVSTTRNAASNYDLLANERGKTVAALLLPPNI